MSLDTLTDLAKNLGGVLAVLFYASIVLWTYKDARRRIDDPILVATSVALSMLPVAGVLVYLLLRPPEYLDDVRERELEIRAMERTLSRQERCPHCRSHIESDYLSCPVCATKLRGSCVTCDRPLDPRWVVCPFCETEVPGRVASVQPTGGRGRGRADVPRESRGPSSSGSGRRAPSAPARPARSARPTAPPKRDEPSGPSAMAGGIAGSRVTAPVVVAEPITSTIVAQPLKPQPFQRIGTDNLPGASVPGTNEQGEH